MINKVLGIILIMGIMLVINGCGNTSEVKAVKVSENKVEDKVMSDVIREDCLRRFELKSNQVHYKECGKKCESEMKWVWYNGGIEVIKKWECGFGMWGEYDINGTDYKRGWGFRG